MSPALGLVEQHRDRREAVDRARRTRASATTEPRRPRRRATRGERAPHRRRPTRGARGGPGRRRCPPPEIEATSSDPSFMDAIVPAGRVYNARLTNEVSRVPGSKDWSRATARFAPSTACRSRSRRESCTASSAPTAPARPPSCRCCRACWRPTKDGSSSTAIDLAARAAEGEGAARRRPAGAGALREPLGAREPQFWGGLYGLSGAPLTQAVDRVLELVGLHGSRQGSGEAVLGRMKRRINLALGSCTDRARC